MDSRLYNRLENAKIYQACRVLYLHICCLLKGFFLIYSKYNAVFVCHTKDCHLLKISLLLSLSLFRNGFSFPGIYFAIFIFIRLHPTLLMPSLLLSHFVSSGGSINRTIKIFQMYRKILAAKFT